MPGYQDKAPGVYIEEITPAGPIAGVGTSTPAFIGKVKKSDATANEPVMITNWTQYVERFEGYESTANNDTYMPHAVRAFFDNGGTKLYVVPVAAGAGGAPPAAPDLKPALATLERLQDISLVCAPGITDATAQKDVLSHCERLKNRFAIFDGKLSDDGKKPVDAVKKQAADVKSTQGYAGLYFPWIMIADPTSTADPRPKISVPPSGYIAGIYGRSDAERGVHKAPANEILRGALDLSYLLNDAEQSILNQAGIDALRVFPGGPPVVWGARTTSDGVPWRYVNVRRLFIYVEESIKLGIRWATFEPNNTALWKKLARTITEFLDRVWRAGALFGKTAQEAFYVRIDEELNPPAVRALGEVYIEIGMAPVRPAEFIVVKIGTWEGGSQVIEG